MSEDNDSSSEGSAGSDDEAATPSPAKTSFFADGPTPGDAEQRQATGEGGAGEDAGGEGEEGGEQSEASVVSDDEEVCRVSRVFVCLES